MNVEHHVERVIVGAAVLGKSIGVIVIILTIPFWLPLYALGWLAQRYTDFHL